MDLREATLDDIKICGQFMANQFASCSVDKLMYLGACASYLSNGGAPCHALSSLSSGCRLCDDLCVDWRSDAFCPVECPAGTAYQACTRATVRTCDNYKSVAADSGLLNDGCFCTGAMVSRHSSARGQITLVLKACQCRVGNRRDKQNTRVRNKVYNYRF